MVARESRSRGGSDGFTLIELLIVVVIIGILAAIAIPQFTSTKERAELHQAAQEQLEIVKGEMDSYYETNGSYPLALDSLQFETTSAVAESLPNVSTTGYVLQAKPGQSNTVYCIVTDTTLAMNAASGTPSYGEVYEAGGATCP